MPTRREKIAAQDEIMKALSDLASMLTANGRGEVSAAVREELVRLKKKYGVS